MCSHHRCKAEGSGGWYACVEVGTDSAQGPEAREDARRNAAVYGAAARVAANSVATLDTQRSAVAERIKQSGQELIAAIEARVVALTEELTEVPLALARV